MVVLGSLPAVDSCLSDRHVSLESHPHVPEPLSVVTTEGDRKRAKKKNRRQRGIGREDTEREREKRVKMCAVCRRVELSCPGSSLEKLRAECVSTSL